MFEIRQGTSKSKKDPQKFIQYEIRRKKFNPIMSNKIHPTSSCLKTTNLPSAFQPISSSTPKRTEKSIEIIDNPVPVTRSAPRLRMSQFIGDIQHFPTKKQNLKTSENNKIRYEHKDFEKSNIANEENIVHLKPLQNPSTLNLLPKCSNVLDSKSQFNVFSKSEKEPPGRYYDENFQLFENYVNMQASSKPAETIHDLSILKEIFSKYITTTGADCNNNIMPQSAKDDAVFKVPRTVVKSNENIMDTILDSTSNFPTKKVFKKIKDNKYAMIDDLSIFEVLPDNIEKDQLNEKVLANRLNSNPSKPKNSFSKVNKNHNNPRKTINYSFDFNETLKHKQITSNQRQFTDSIKKSHFEKKLQEFLNITTGSGEDAGDIISIDDEQMEEHNSILENFDFNLSSNESRYEENIFNLIFNKNL